MTTRRMPWFKLYYEARTDDKLRVLADDEHRVWFNLLCYAAEQDDRGTVEPTDPFVLAVKVSNGDEELLARTLNKLVKLDIVSRAEDGLLTFVHFDQRQYGKPSNHPKRVSARVKAFRGRKSAVSNAPVTPLLSRDKKGEEDKEIDDGDKSPSVASADATPTEEPVAQPRTSPEPKGFAVFWKAYPKKVGKAKALEQWSRMRPPPDLVQTILDAVESQKRGRKWQEGYVMEATRWLRERRWEDEVETGGPARASPNGMEPDPKEISTDGGLSAWKAVGQRRGEA